MLLRPHINRLRTGLKRVLGGVHLARCNAGIRFRARGVAQLRTFVRKPVVFYLLAKGRETAKVADCKSLGVFCHFQVGFAFFAL